MPSASLILSILFHTGHYHCESRVIPGIHRSGPDIACALQKDLRVQPLACGSFAKRAVVHATSGSARGVPGRTIVP